MREMTVAVPELHGYEQSARRCCLFHGCRSAAGVDLALADACSSSGAGISNRTVSAITITRKEKRGPWYAPARDC